MTIPKGTPKLVMFLPMPSFFSQVVTQVPKLATEEAVVMAITSVDRLFFSKVMGCDLVRSAASKIIPNAISTVRRSSARNGFQAESTTSNVPDQTSCTSTMKINEGTSLLINSIRNCRSTLICSSVWATNSVCVPKTRSAAPTAAPRKMICSENVVVLCTYSLLNL